MGIDLLTPQDQIDNIPLDGPVVAVANHPHGLVDGMILADLIGRRRTDYKILTRALLTGIDEVAASYMISVPFPHEPDAQRKSVEMRANAMAHLKEGGLISVFPSGVVASSDTLLGPVHRTGMECLYRADDPAIRCQGGADLFPRLKLARAIRWQTAYRRRCGRACCCMKWSKAATGRKNQWLANRSMTSG